MPRALKVFLAHSHRLFKARSALVVVAIALLQLACTTENRDVSGVKPYSTMVGRTYRIVGAVGAFGIYVRGSGSNPTFVALYPSEQSPTGPEVVFSRPVQAGRTFRIVSASIFDKPIDDTVFYTVLLEGESIAEGTPVQVRLQNNNGAGEFDLNPSYYEYIK